MKKDNRMILAVMLLCVLSFFLFSLPCQVFAALGRALFCVLAATMSLIVW